MSTVLLLPALTALSLQTPSDSILATRQTQHDQICQWHPSTHTRRLSSMVVGAYVLVTAHAFHHALQQRGVRETALWEWIHQLTADAQQARSLPRACWEMRRQQWLAWMESSDVVGWGSPALLGAAWKSVCLMQLVAE
ncbi:MAG: hypothetical protein M1837_002244 [Sclerophora amabilis]|nr:MAG: hypothetical protein M1837_002244 [Sclerophora amabilis]